MKKLLLTEQELSFLKRLLENTDPDVPAIASLNKKIREMTE